MCEHDVGAVAGGRKFGYNEEGIQRGSGSVGCGLEGVHENGVGAVGCRDKKATGRLIGHVVFNNCGLESN